MNVVQEYVHPTGRTPKAVAILALGTSAAYWSAHCLRKGSSMFPPVDERWAINRGIRVWPAELAFVMDDLRREKAEDPEYGQALHAWPHPIITSKGYPEFPQAVEYPLRDIARMVATPPTSKASVYLHNSIPQALALAELLQVERVVLVGADYTRPDGLVVEAGRSCVEYWIARLHLRGTEVWLPEGTTLMRGGPLNARDYVYGYDLQWEARQAIREGWEQVRPPAAGTAAGPSP